MILKDPNLFNKRVHRYILGNVNMKTNTLDK